MWMMKTVKKVRHNSKVKKKPGHTGITDSSNRAMGPACRKCSQRTQYTGKRICILLANGNEEILNLVHCKNCALYYIEGYEDVFASEDKCNTWLYGPYDEEFAEKFKGQVEKCPEPTNKYCDCKAHGFAKRLIYGTGE